MSKLPRFFIVSAGILLGLTGLAKMISACGNALLLDQSEPVLGFSFRTVFLIVGSIELVIAGLCLLSNKNKLSTMLILWMATSFLVYRIGLWQIGWKRPCHCLGNLTDALHISPEAADLTMKFILAYLLAGGAATLAFLWKQDRAKTLSAPSAPSQVADDVAREAV